MVRRRGLNFSRWLVLACVAVFVTHTAVRAVAESWLNDNFPEALAIKVETLPLIFPIHMIAGGLTLLLVPVAFLLRGGRFHTSFGRAAAVTVIVAGLTAIPVALEYPVTQISAWGFVAQALTWLSLLGAGIWHIRQGHMAEHRVFMLMMAAVTSGALFFRLFLGVWKIIGWKGGFDTFYAVNAWIAWILPLGGMIGWLAFQHRTKRPGRQKALVAVKAIG